MVNAQITTKKLLKTPNTFSQTQPLALHLDVLGAHAVYFDGEDRRVTYVRDRRGERPWSAGWGRHRAENEDEN